MSKTSSSVSQICPFWAWCSASPTLALGPDGTALRSMLAFAAAGVWLIVTAHTLRQTKPRRSEPWEHLRKRRFVADCFLNQFTVAEYRSLFEQHSPGLGHEFLTDNIRTELSAYSADELLSEKWQFVVKKK